ncbi:MAG: hypothetical protein H5T76_19755, partial [Streptomyces sp.]|nr:hypothetical protein [Streptomyces sp.]
MGHGVQRVVQRSLIAANGFVARKDGGLVRLTGHETFAVRVTGEQTDGALAFMDGAIEPEHGNVPHI